MKKPYELVVLFAPSLTSDALQKAQDAVSKLITARGGSELKVEVWGRKVLAYKIGKAEDAVYVLYTFMLEPAKAQGLEKSVQITEGIIRQLMVVSDTQEAS